MSNAQDLTTDEFDTTVGKGVTLVDFWAEWCGPCRMMGPVLDQLASEYTGKAQIRKVNVDNEPDLAMRYDVSSIPTMLVFKDGELKKRFVGVTTKGELATAIDGAAS